jgi:hypothetical protein
MQRCGQNDAARHHFADTMKVRMSVTMGAAVASEVKI